MKTPMINLGLITQPSPYIAQNPVGFFFTSRMIFCFCFYSFDGKNKSLFTAPPLILALSAAETQYPGYIIKKAWITP